MSLRKVRGDASVRRKCWSRIRSSAAPAAQQEPVGISKYNSLQATFTHRITQGLIFMASYTYSKFLGDAGDALGWSNISGGGASIRNYYDLKADRIGRRDGYPAVSRHELCLRVAGWEGQEIRRRHEQHRG